jgi:hypothetical protein
MYTYNYIYTHIIQIYIYYLYIYRELVKLGYGDDIPCSETAIVGSYAGWPDAIFRSPGSEMIAQLFLETTRS